ncbi:hypothetical protein [Streptomyces sp. NPDC029004]|uniref:hypothetical protein n=1 Tax=Streptomyces sp. NPDC029004 TaxID=3154490 RepID=UPI0033E6DFEF
MTAAASSHRTSVRWSAWCTCAGTTQQVKELVEPFRPYLVQPGHTFYLRCTDATLRDRMAGKQDYNQDDDMVNVPGRLTRLRTSFDKIAAADPTGVIIDTDDHTPAQLADTITTYLAETSPCPSFRTPWSSPAPKTAG